MDAMLLVLLYESCVVATADWVDRCAQWLHITRQDFLLRRPIGFLISSFHTSSIFRLHTFV